MNNKYKAQTSVAIRAPISEVWKALTDPVVIRQYFMGVEVKTDWREGSPITYKGQWQGQPFEDKGKILKIEPGRRLIVDYWSSFSGLPDLPENYQKVEYNLAQQDGTVGLTITQEDLPSEESQANSEQNWLAVLNSLKKLLEQ